MSEIILYTITSKISVRNVSNKNKQIRPTENYTLLKKIFKF